MSFDASGTYTRSNGADGWKTDAANGVKILASLHDVHDSDLAKGLSDCLNRRGAGGALSDISWGGFKITNLGDPDQPGDAVSLRFLKNFGEWEKAINITGADLNGRLNFTSPAGVNGVTWTYANMAMVARHSKSGEGRNRLVYAPTSVPSTTLGLGDVFIVDDQGNINSGTGTLTHNLSLDSAIWRTITPGFGTKADLRDGRLMLSVNDTATITNNYAVAGQRTFFQAMNSDGSSYTTLMKSASTKVNSIRGQLDNARHWEMFLGDSTAVTGTASGSNFVINRFNNAGAGLGAALTIARDTGNVTFSGDVSAASVAMTGAVMTVGGSNDTFTMQRSINTGLSVFYGGAGAGAYLQLFGPAHSTYPNDFYLGVGGIYRFAYQQASDFFRWFNNVPANTMSLDGSGNLTLTGVINANTNFVSTTTTATLAAANGGQILLRPNGPGSTVEQVEITSLGDLVGSKDIYAGTAGGNGGGTYLGLGFRSRNGNGGGSIYASAWINFNWTGSVLTAYANGSTLGNVSFACDYRIKKDVRPLCSMWDKIKQLNPISYSQRAYEVWTEDDEVRWGFLAHELQEKLSPSAASGVKDGPDVQVPNLLALVAALAKGLQEAMQRIEQLECAA